MDDVAKASLAVSHAFIAVSVAVIFPNAIGITVAALVAYLLVFY